MTAREQPGDGGDDGGERVSDEELLRWAGDIAKARGRVQAARDVGLNYRTLANAIDEGQLTRHVREALLATRRAESAQEAQPAGGAERGVDAACRGGRGAARGCARRVRPGARPGGCAGAPAGVAGGATGRRAGHGAVGQNTRGGAAGRSAEYRAGGRRSRLRGTRSGAREPWRAPGRAGVVTLEPLAGEEDALGEAAALVASGGGCGARTRGGGAQSTGRAPRSAAGSWNSR